MGGNQTCKLISVSHGNVLNFPKSNILMVDFFVFLFFFQNFSMICALTHPALPLVENSCALVENIEDA